MIDPEVRDTAVGMVYRIAAHVACQQVKVQRDPVVRIVEYLIKTDADITWFPMTYGGHLIHESALPDQFAQFSQCFP